MKKHYHRQIVQTEDGSMSLFLPEMQEHYHSVHGAIQESLHVFISEGFEKVASRSKLLSVLEVGLGTGLNCLLTAIQAKKHQLSVSYTALEPFPLIQEEYSLLNYHQMIEEEGVASLINDIHVCEFETVHWLTPSFSFRKLRQTVQDVILPESSYNLIYYDAFGPQVEPDMWEPDIFQKMFACLKNEGVLVTYCARGSVKRTLKACGFVLEHPKGPPGKREITRGGKV